MNAATSPAAIWIDANVILRLLTGKPTAQADAAEALVRRAERGELRLWVCTLTVAEVLWVLTSSYGFTRTASAETLFSFLDSDGLILDEGPVLLAALRTCASESVDFADAYVAERARLQGVPVASFDRDFDRLGVERLSLA